MELIHLSKRNLASSLKDYFHAVFFKLIVMNTFEGNDKDISIVNERLSEDHSFNKDSINTYVQ